MAGGGGKTSTQSVAAEKQIDPLTGQAKGIRDQSQRELAAFAPQSLNLAQQYGKQIQGLDPTAALQGIGSAYSPAARSASLFAQGGRGDVAAAGQAAGRFIPNIGKAYQPVISGFQRAARDPGIAAAQDLSRRTIAGGYLNAPDIDCRAGEIA